MHASRTTVRGGYRAYVIGIVSASLLILWGPQIPPDVGASQRDEVDVRAVFALLKSQKKDEVRRGDQEYFAIKRWPAAAIPFLVAELLQKSVDTLSEEVSGLSIDEYAFEALVTIGTPAAPALADMIVRHGDADARVRALKLLARIGVDANESIPSLLVCTRDQDEVVRYFAVKSLVSVMREPCQVLPELVRCLDDSSPDVKSAAVRGLGVIGPTARTAVPKLLQLSRTKEIRREDQLSFVPLRADVVLTLGMIGKCDEVMVSRVEAILEDDDPLVRIAAARAYWRLSGGFEKSLTSLKKELGSRSLRVSVVCGAIEAIAELGCRASPVSDELIALLTHRHWEVRAAAVRATPNVMPGEYIEHIAPLLGDDHWLVRSAVIETIGRDDANDAKRIDIFIVTLDDPDHFVRMASLNALSRMASKAKKAIPRLEVMVSSGRGAERKFAEEVLKNVKNSIATPNCREQ